MRHLLSISQLILSLSLFMVSLSASAPQVSQQTLDALQQRDIDNVRSIAMENKNSIEKIFNEIAAMRSSMDRFTGIGIGFGGALTVLQCLQLILQLRKTRHS